MSIDHSESADTHSNGSEDDSQEHAGGDDERANRENISETGEPQRDALGNADGAS